MPVGSFTHAQDVYSARLPTRDMTSYFFVRQTDYSKTFLSHPVKAVFLFCFFGEGGASRRKKAFHFLFVRFLF
jgi:hypothetical protein